jgi:tripartite-type tricarboxylate transporter receptor subunit TctC
MLRLPHLLIATLSILASAQVAPAQAAYPRKLIRLIVPFAPGGNTDVVGRITAEYMARVLKTDVVVENRVGAGGLLGTGMAAKADADGYTLCVCGVGPIAVSPSTDKLTYDPLTDFAPVSLVNTNPLVLLVNPQVNARTGRELVALSRSTPGGMNYATGGIGGLTHFSAEILRVKNHMPVSTVPYRGGVLATAAIVSGEVPFGFANMSDAISQLPANSVRAISVTTATRNPLVPDAPTLLEEGLIDFPIESWNGVLAPAGTPQPIIDRLAQVLAEMAKDPAHRQRLLSVGSIAVANTPSEFQATIREDMEQWAKALKLIGLAK